MGSENTGNPELLLHHLLELFKIVVFTAGLGLDHAVAQMHCVYMDILFDHTDVVDGGPAWTLTPKKTYNHWVIVLGKLPILLLDRIYTLVFARTTIACIHIGTATNNENVHFPILLDNLNQTKDL